MTISTLTKNSTALVLLVLALAVDSADGLTSPSTSVADNGPSTLDTLPLPRFLVPFLPRWSLPNRRSNSLDVNSAYFVSPNLSRRKAATKGSAEGGS